MPDRPSSLAQFVKLGKRLAQPGEPSSADLALLQEWLLAYDAPLTYVTQRLSQHGLHPVHRIKTTPVLIEKLRRSPGIAITHIRDIAGARIVVRDMTTQPVRSCLSRRTPRPSLWSERFQYRPADSWAKKSSRK